MTKLWAVLDAAKAREVADWSTPSRYQGGANKMTRAGCGRGQGTGIDREMMPVVGNQSIWQSGDNIQTMAMTTQSTMLRTHLTTSHQDGRPIFRCGQSWKQYPKWMWDPFDHQWDSNLQDCGMFIIQSWKFSFYNDWRVLPKCWNACLHDNIKG